MKLKLIDKVVGLPESKAKLALLALLLRTEETLDCEECPVGCERPSWESCLNMILDDVLAEVEAI